jgi:hypothetical protein
VSISERGKDKAVSFTPSMTLTVIAATVTAAAKATVPEVFKSKSFAGSRFKFKAFCTQVKLGIWADLKRSAEKKLMRYTED